MRGQSPMNRKQRSNTPGTRRDREQKARDEECFGGEIEEMTAEDFDFESNLALFDKKMVLDEITAAENKPDLIRLVDSNRRKDPQTPKTEPKFRNDENVLGAQSPPQYRPIETGEKPSPGEYVTDSGLVVPAVSYELRRKLEKTVEEKGFSLGRLTELVGRAGAELSVGMFFGGAHRLNPENAHQLPLAVILCGPSRSGVYGLSLARHLSAQGVRTMAYLPDLPHYPDHLRAELNLYKLTGAKWTRKAEYLPKNAVDLVIVALEDHEMWQQERSQPWLKSARKWANESRAPAFMIDPPNEPSEAVVSGVKASLLPGLPLWHPGHGAGRLFMVNTAVPGKVYEELGVKYASPFGAKTVAALHKIT